ncbi:tetratricopeptide repeat-containing sensor histidine kinase [Psychroserpens ponticola]|uniref:Tetratricopeptide repeat protein n=1 Tax=Psychroserpens ponticola TaxID=2932268 RepID=A0ABY7S105_9FLAO|nr:tetratricopeptide repeat protein [Psychroserpens ponticola]WCO02675.1 tetratricopeptide repeat protein [Psychroserpens ponticola]
MNKVFLFCLLIFSCFKIQSQSKVADSLIIIVSQTTDKVDKLQLFNQISNVYKTSSGEQVIFFGEKALQLAKELNLKQEEGYAYVNLGNGNIIIGNYDKAVDCFFKAKTLFEIVLEKNPTEDVKKSLARAYGSIGIVSSEQSNYSRAFQYYLKSIKIYEEVNDVNMLSRLYNNVGVAYRSQKEFSKALQYFEKAKVIQQQLNDSNIGITLTNIANCYLELNTYTEAYSYYKEAGNAVKTNPRALGEWHNSMGLYYKKTNNIEAAVEHWDKAILAFNSINDKFGIADTYLFKGQLFLEQKQYKKALENASKALSLATETNVLEQIILAEKVLSAANEKQNNLFEALRHYKLYATFQDSLLNDQSIRKGVQAEMNFEYEKKESLEKLEREKQQLIIVEEAKQSRLRLIFISVAALLLCGFIFLYFNKMQLKKRLTLQNELIAYEQKALHLQMNPHFIFNCLGAISGFIINNGTDHAIKYLAKFSKLMRLTLEYSKEALIPIEKEIESLQNYLELEQLRFNNVFDFNITKSNTIEDAVAISPLLIQPLVENGIIHGLVAKKEKGKITIDFSTKQNMIICTIQDNGIGIDNSVRLKEDSVQIHKSMALKIIEKRLKMISKIANTQASLDCHQINDANGNSLGTKVIISIPIQYID